MTELPNGVDGFIKFLAANAKQYDNQMDRVEVARFKADLMNATDRWLVVDPAAFEAACLLEGMRPEDAAELTGYLRRRKMGKRLVPNSSYRDYRFPVQIEVYPVRPSTITSRVW